MDAQKSPRRVTPLRIIVLGCKRREGEHQDLRLELPSIAFVLAFLGRVAERPCAATGKL